MIPKFRVWLPNPDVERMLRVKALVFEHDKTRCVCGYAYDFYLEDEDAIIMQSTRLVDKEGTEVFEGDILCHQIQAEYTFIVKYDKDKGRWYGDGLSRTYQIDITTDFLKYYTVIGNIYENPEVWKNCRRRKNILKNVIKTLEK